MFHQHFQSDCLYRTQDITGPFSAYCEFIPEKIPEPKDVLAQFVDDRGEVDPIMQEKIDIISSRPKGKGKLKNAKHAHVQEEKVEKPKPIPGFRLMKKLHKQNQMEQSLQRVIKNLV